MKQRVEEMEREAQKLRELQAAAENANGGSVHDGSEAGVPMDAEDDKSISDGRSVFVGNVSSFATVVLTCFVYPNHIPRVFRWITALRQKRYRDTSKLAVPSTE